MGGLDLGSIAVYQAFWSKETPIRRNGPAREIDKELSRCQILFAISYKMDLRVL